MIAGKNRRNPYRIPLRRASPPESLLRRTRTETLRKTLAPVPHLWHPLMAMRLRGRLRDVTEVTRQRTRTIKQVENSKAPVTYVNAVNLVI